jgi:hypothetical protein
LKNCAQTTGHIARFPGTCQKRQTYLRKLWRGEKRQVIDKLTYCADPKGTLWIAMPHHEYYWAFCAGRSSELAITQTGIANPIVLGVDN